MAKRNGKKEREKREKKPFLDLDPDVLKGIWGIFFIASAVFLTLSFLGRGGVVGDITLNILNGILGAGKYIVPVVLVTTAIIFFTSWRRSVYISTLLGIVLFFSSILGAFALISYDRMLGGIWGYMIISPILALLGAWGAVLLLLTMFVVSLLITLNLSLGKLFLRSKEDANEPGAASGAGQGDDSGVSRMKVRTLGEEGVLSADSFAQKNGPTEARASSKETKKESKKTEDVFEVSPARAMPSDFHLPPVDLLEKETTKPHSGDIVANANIIKRTLQNFGIEVEMGEVNVGPTVTQFTLKPAEGVKLARIVALHNDLALALAAYPLRIEAPIPKRALVGIEVPNKGIATVRLKNLIDNDGFKEQAGKGLVLAVGRDVSGSAVYANIAKMPHLLIAGSTGSGKTIALNIIVLSLLYQHPPELLRLILIDPKRVEFHVYSNIPHLLAPVITDNQKAINAMRWAVSEMDRRFDLLARAHARDIQGYNANKKAVEENGPLPYIVLMVDELADIMASRGKEAEALIVRLAQMSRAVGIHLVLATQRPSVEVLTGLIKANITARMAFQVASQVDARTILDMAGAEKLLGSGDMLYLPPESSKPIRVQGAYVNENEIKRITDFLREEGNRVGRSVEREDVAITEPSERTVDFDNFDDGDIGDALYEEARQVVVQARRASSSLLQRRLRVGYARAARLIDMLEERGVVGPGEGAKPREVYETEVD